MKLKSLIAIAALCASLGLNAATLQFNNSGHFKIAQFTDLHWTPESDNCKLTEATIRAVVAQERPDFAVLSGDVVTADPAMEGWQSVVNIFNDLKLPFTVEMGNHDAEYLSKDVIFDFVMQSPYYIGDKGPADIFGCGNCVIPIYSSTDATAPAALVYCLDSNDYQPDKDLGKYDWIHFDQIQWYRSQSQRFTAANGGAPLPALALFHIATPEFAELTGDQNTFGTQNEGIASARLNSGAFTSFVEMKDVMGVFVGHDHDNEHVGIIKNIALGFGRVTGTDAYGDFTRGARIIDLYEGQRQFDTWVTTPSGREPVYYYPSGLNSKEEQTMTYLPSVNTKPGKQGVRYAYYEGRFKHIADINTAKAVKTGTMDYPTIVNAPIDDHFAYTFDALIDIPERAVYRFYTYSDDGSKLFIDGVEVVDNDGGHSARRAEGKIALEKGLHRLQVRYFEDYMGQELEIGYSSRNHRESPIPPTMLFIEK
jgi:hypothetical protein